MQVLVVGGRYAGVRAELEGIDVDAFKADVRLLDAPHEGLQACAQRMRRQHRRPVAWLTRTSTRARVRAQLQLEYEQVCKTDVQ
jgi:hypothetical protein